MTETDQPALPLPEDPIRLDGRVALITGAGGDIGGATASALALRGASVISLDLETSSMEGFPGRLGGSILPAAADVRDEAGFRTVVEQASSWRGRPDILVNCAGVEGQVAALADYDAAEFRRVLDINVTGVFLAMKIVVPGMQERGRGSIVNVSSVAGLRGSPGMAAYVASKHAVIGLTRAASTELAPAGIRVNCVCPGSVAGEMTRRIAIGRDEQAPERALSDMSRRVPIGRQGSPREIAEVIAFLVSDAASFVTGAVYAADGGRSAI